MAEREKNVSARSISCTLCGAVQRWDPASGSLLCDHCGERREVPPGRASIEEIEVARGYAAGRDGFGLQTRSFVCARCGARVSLGVELTARRCTFCGSPQVTEEDDRDDLVRPAALIPMAVSEDEARRLFRRWIACRWFRPRALRRAHLGGLHGIYVPYWTFDALVFSSWTAQSGTYYWVSESFTTFENGKPVVRTRQVRKIRWWPSSGTRTDRHDDVLVCGSRSLPPNLVAKLDTFRTADLVPYRPEYLAGFFAERYAVGLPEAHRAARSRMEAVQAARCAGDVPGDTHRFLSVRNTFSQETYKHVLLPIWLLSYGFRKRTFRVLINGQTGEVEGEAPLSYLAIAVLIGGVLLIIAAVFFFVGS